MALFQSPRAHVGLVAVLAAVLSAGLLSGCHITPAPCVAAGGCGAGEECLASTCVPEVGGEPVPSESLRLTLLPRRWQVTSQRGLTGQPPAVYLGGPADEELLLDFAVAGSVPGGSRQLERAFLVLTPLPGGPESGELVDVSVARLVEPFGRGVPRRGHPISRGLSRTSLPLRVDVTALVERWLDNPHSSYGMAVTSSGSAGLAHAYATGLGGGAAPQLELYYREESSRPRARHRARPERGSASEGRRSRGREAEERRRARPRRSAEEPTSKDPAPERAQPRKRAQPRGGAERQRPEQPAGSAAPQRKAEPRSDAAPQRRPSRRTPPRGSAPDAEQPAASRARTPRISR